MKFETRAIRLQTERTNHREHSTPIFPTSSFVFDSAEQMRDVFAGDEKGNIYSRFTNPTVREFEIKMASLENGEDAIATASGMAAVFTSFASNLKQGDHLLLSRAIFGSTYKMSENFLCNWGIEYDFLDPREPIENWDQFVRPNTKMLYLETPSNPGLQIYDLTEVANWCKSHNILSVVDNCFATPYLQKPLKFGIDIVVHSATKFIDGQGRVLGGAIVSRKEFIEKAFTVLRNLGPTLSPFNAWVLTKSLETLAIRMDRHCENAEKLVTFLEKHSNTDLVRYPFSPNHPSVEIAKKQMKKGGGIVTFEIKGGQENGSRFLNNLKLISLTANLGDTRTIASHPFSTTHRKLEGEVKQLLGITPGLIRISLGLEHIDDITEDISQALTNI